MHLALNSHCSSCRQIFASAHCMSLLENSILRTMLKSASRITIVQSKCIFLILFFSDITSTICYHLTFINPYMKGRLRIMLRHTAKSSSLSTIFQMKCYSPKGDNVILSDTTLYSDWRSVTLIPWGTWGTVDSLAICCKALIQTLLFVARYWSKHEWIHTLYHQRSFTLE